MEKALLKLARQLNAYDEASLTALWNKYEATVSEFEPTRKWEEAAVVFGMIQAVRLKNQLFNYHWADSCGPEAMSPRPDFVPVKSDEAQFEGIAQKSDSKSDGESGGGDDKKRRKVLSFTSRKDS
nr:hypothetical protein [Maridesulfovibrio frigidus]